MAYIEKTINSEIVYDGPVFKVRKHRVDTINGESIRDVVEHSGGAVMIAVKDNGKIIMEKQFRKPLEKVIFELPAGKIDPNEDPMNTAYRELIEETGYRAGTVKHLTSYTPTCGYSNEILHVYLMKDLTPGETDPDPTECVDVLEYDADTLIEMILNKEITDGKTILGILLARQLGEI